MTKRMLIDASHAEETRVVVLDGSRLEDFDVETAAKRQLKGNIYLAKVVRVEPSLQAAFVEYGGNRHGFLAFGEIHPDYYQIPVADRQRLIEAQEAEAREEEAAEDAAAAADANGPISQAGAADSPPEDERYAFDDEPLESSAREDAPQQGADPGDATAPMDGAVETIAMPDQPIETVGGQPAGPIAPIEADVAREPHAPAGTASFLPTEEPSPSQPLAIASEIVRGEPVDEAAAEETADLFQRAEPLMSEPATLLPRDDSPPAAALETEAQLETGSEHAPAEAVAEQPGSYQESVDESIGADLAPEAREPAEEPSEELGARPTEADRDEAPDGAAESTSGESEPRDRGTPRFLRNYKIQEVIRRRQILLIQVVKEERGSKGAALTTYISLAGRYSVLMPNSPRGGGISRKITSAADRRRLKEVMAELRLPRGMGLIVRTAGAARPKAEILRDGEYLLNQWDAIRDLTMKSTAPALIYEEANLIKRAIRDVYSRDVDEIQVDGEEGWRNARDFMRMLMPAHARKVQLWREPQPLFAKMQVEAQLDAMLSPTVQLRSGGYLVINQTEALVAIDVNSGRSTKERGIEETALRTNMEAAEEVARQLRLRDLAGLIVIDFIDMEQRRHNAMVERQIKDALRHDRARIQLGSISHFGLLEMSRQRLRPSLAETSFVPCAVCGGTGHVRGTDSAALVVLRAVEEEGAKRRAAEIVVHCAGGIAFYILNHKRVRLGEIEARYGMTVAFAADESLRAPDVRIERVRAQTSPELPAPVSGGGAADPRYAAIDAADALEVEAPDEYDAELERDEEAPAAHEAGAAEASAEETPAQSEARRRRRRRRGGRREDAPPLPIADAAIATVGPADESSKLADASADGEMPTGAEPDEGDQPDVAPALPAEQGQKRRSRRGGRRRRREPDGSASTAGTDQPEDADAIVASFDPAPETVPSYTWTGPTPADPFGGGAAYDIFDALEAAEEQRLSAQTAAVAIASSHNPPAAPDEPVTEEQHATAEAQAPVPAPADVVPAPERDLPVDDPLPWTTPEPEPASAETAAAPYVEAIAPPAEAEAMEHHAESPQAELGSGPEASAETVAAAPDLETGVEAAEKRRGWWRR